MVYVQQMKEDKLKEEKSGEKSVVEWIFINYFMMGPMDMVAL